MKRLAFPILLLLLAFSVASAQEETLTNSLVVEMSKAGLEKSIVLLKIQESKCGFDVSTRGLIELRKSGVENDIIAAMIECASKKPEPAPAASSETSPTDKPFPATPSNVPTMSEALDRAKTVWLTKNSVNPSIQALEKELLKRPEWQRRKLEIIRYGDQADLLVEVSFVHFSLITHRYTWRLYERQSGVVIAAGETTSWGSLAENLARDIAKKLAALEKSQGGTK